jgi:hypothetical protein
MITTGNMTDEAICKTNGRSCYMHDCCGDSLCVNVLLQLVICAVTINKKTEEVVKFVHVPVDGDGCTIGYLPKVWMSLPLWQKTSTISTWFKRSMMSLATDAKG